MRDCQRSIMGRFSGQCFSVAVLCNLPNGSVLEYS